MILVIDVSMSGDVSSWDDKFLARVYEKVTGENVEVEEDSALALVDLPITGVEEKDGSVIVDYISIGLKEVKPDSVAVPKEKLIEEVEERDTTNH